MPAKQGSYEAVHLDMSLEGYKLDVNTSSKRPDKKDMRPGIVYLYYGDYTSYLYKKEPYQGNCYAFINSKGIIQRGQLDFALRSSDSKNIASILAGHGNAGSISARDVCAAISRSIKAFKTAEIHALDQQYNFLLADFRAELELRCKYNLQQMNQGSLTQELCDEFKEDAEDLLKSIHDLVTPDFHNPTGIWDTLLDRKDPDGSKLKLVNEVLMRGKMALEIPASQSEKACYINNLEQMKLLSNEFLERNHPKASSFFGLIGWENYSSKIGLIMMALAAVSLVVVLAVPSFGASLAIPVVAGIMTALQFGTPALMFTYGLYLFHKNGQSVENKLSHFEETAEEIQNKCSP